MQGVDVELIDPTESASQIRVRSAAVSDGYFPEPDEQKLGNGVFVPDDLLAATRFRAEDRGPGFGRNQCRREKSESGGSRSAFTAF